MNDSVLNVLTEAGPLGVFALYLIWQRQKDTMRMEALQENFLTRLDAMDERSDAAVASLRDRYDKVLEEYRRERESMLAGFSKLDQLIVRIGMPSTAAPAPAPPPSLPAVSQSPTTSMIERKVQRAVKEALSKDEE